MPQPDHPNVPVPDELAAVRDQIRDLTAREDELKRLLLTNADLRTGAAWLAEIKKIDTTYCDLKELRAMHGELVAEYTFPKTVTRIELSEISEDGEITRRKRRSA